MKEGFDWGVAKLVKARDFDSRMRRFESCRPSQPKTLAGRRRLAAFLKDRSGISIAAISVDEVTL
jgi:hypothetical protein